MVHLLKTKKEFKKLCKREIQIMFTRMMLIKLFFQHDMAYGKYKDSNKRRESDKVLRDEALKLQLIQK